jgi:hypothetical protein
MGDCLKFGSATFRYGVRQFLDLSLSETVIGLASGESGDAGSDKRFEQATPTTELGRMSGLFLARECACWP